MRPELPIRRHDELGGKHYLLPAFTVQTVQSFSQEMAPQKILIFF
jgi:hypothetical protein